MTTFAHYACAYRGAAMGTLSFSELSVRPLGRAHAFVGARRHLALPKGRTAGGLFSLVLQDAGRPAHCGRSLAPRGSGG